MVNDATKLSMKSNYFNFTKFEVAYLIKELNQRFLWMYREIVYKNYGGSEARKTALRIDGAHHSWLSPVIIVSQNTQNP